MSRFSVDELPPEILGPSAWYGPDLDAYKGWIEELSDAEIAEIDEITLRTAERMAEPRHDIPRLKPEDFPLPTLGPRLRTMLDELLNGRGFVLIRGLPIEKWSEAECAVAFFGLGTHLGNARSQNALGHVLGHVKDLGRS